MDNPERQSQSPLLDQSATSAAELLTPETSTSSPQESSAQPIRSAKDAINAMYSGNSTHRLSDYLAASTQGMKASNKQSSPASKSASSMHRHSTEPRRIESVRPSAASLLKTAGGQTKALRPVRTSLKLAPKKPPLTAPPSSLRAEKATLPAAQRLIRPRKGQISLSRELTNRKSISGVRKVADIKTAAAINTIKAAATTATSSKAPASAKATTKSVTPKPTSVKAAVASSNGRQRVFQDVIRPARPSTALSDPSSAKHSEESATATTSKTAKKSKTKTPKAKTSKPLDSIKNRFRLAPKGYAAANASEADKGRPYRVEDFMNPSHPVKEAVKETIHFYGMTDGPEPASDTHLSEVPLWANPDSATAPANEGDLGVVEDFRPQTATSNAQTAPDHSHPTQTPLSTPDNSRYALGGDSPFFLKSVTVEKRPLSDGPTRLSQETENPIYAAQHLDSPAKSRKNVYDKKSSKPAKKASKTKKTVPKNTEPTVIIPARRRSHGALFLLLLITVILGAVVGAAAYLFLFQ